MAAPPSLLGPMGPQPPPPPPPPPAAGASAASAAPRPQPVQNSQQVPNLPLGSGQGVPMQAPAKKPDTCWPKTLDTSPPCEKGTHYEAYVLRRATDGGGALTWRRVRMQKMRVSDQDIAMLGRLERNPKGVMAQYDALKHDSMREAVDGAMNDRNAAEESLLHEWQLALVDAKKESYGTFYRQAIVTVQIRVILKRVLRANAQEILEQQQLAMRMQAQARAQAQAQAQNQAKGQKQKDQKDQKEQKNNAQNQPGQQAHPPPPPPGHPHGPPPPPGHPPPHGHPGPHDPNAHYPPGHAPPHPMHHVTHPDLVQGQPTMPTGLMYPGPQFVPTFDPAILGGTPPPPPPGPRKKMKKKKKPNVRQVPQWQQEFTSSPTDSDSDDQFSSDPESEADAPISIVKKPGKKAKVKSKSLPKRPPAQIADRDPRRPSRSRSRVPSRSHSRSVSPKSYLRRHSRRRNNQRYRRGSSESLEDEQYTSDETYSTSPTSLGSDYRYGTRRSSTKVGVRHRSHSRPRRSDSRLPRSRPESPERDYRPGRRRFSEIEPYFQTQDPYLLEKPRTTINNYWGGSPAPESGARVIPSMRRRDTVPYIAPIPRAPSPQQWDYSRRANHLSDQLNTQHEYVEQERQRAFLRGRQAEMQESLRDERERIAAEREQTRRKVDRLRGLRVGDRAWEDEMEWRRYHESDVAAGRRGYGGVYDPPYP